MDPTHNAAGSTALWRQYRLAFQHFSDQARTVQRLKAEATPDVTSVESALLELERARVEYSNTRDLLAYSLMQRPQVRQTHPDSDAKREYTARVRRIAELLWELEGRRDGRADEHWFRAERIVQCSLAS